MNTTDMLNEFVARWGSAVRPPTPDEAARFARPDDGTGDAVLELVGTDAALQVVADVCASSGYCDAAHVLPGVGVYLEE